MPQTVTELFDAAIALPEADRAKLAELLAASLSTTSTLNPAWKSELARRAAEIDAGRVTPVAWDEVRQQIRDQLASGESNNG
jgi:putative addiction module component (TIGR02574 family)